MSFRFQSHRNVLVNLEGPCFMSFEFLEITQKGLYL